MLYIFTVTINLIALSVAIWLGTYIVTRSPRSPVAWLAGLTLWLMAGPFLNVLLALSLPPSPNFVPPWVVPLLWFWPPGVFEHGQSAWLEGWQATLAFTTWHHLSVLLRYGRMNVFRWIRVIAGYVVAFVLILAQRYTGQIYISLNGDPLTLSTLLPGPLHPVYVASLLFFGVYSIVNLANSARQAPSRVERRQLNLMLVATSLVGVISLGSVLIYDLGFIIPRVSLTALLCIPLFLLGYAVARYSALAEGRVIGRDFAYNGLAVLVVTFLYFTVVWSSVKAYGVPTAALVAVVVLSILTHSLIDTGRRFFDRIFYRRETRQLRERLRNLTERAAAPEALEEALALSLETLCGLVGATFALLLLFKEDELQPVASYGWRRAPLPLHANDLVADDILALPPARYPFPLEESRLLIPLFSGDRQQGALILGRPKNAESYTKSDVELLLDPADRIADALRDAQREQEHLARLAQMAQTPLVRPDLETGLPTRVVEEALRNLFDFAYLADTPLARRASAVGVTHLDRGKQVYQTMLDVLEKLRPPGDPPREPIPRQWYPYIILHDAYLDNKPNNEIMMRLYISEGTFNRTRRAAIRSMTRTFMELGMLAA